MMRMKTYRRSQNVVTDQQTEVRKEDSRQAGKMLFVSVSVALKGWLPADEVPCEKPHTVREGEFFFLKKDFFWWQGGACSP